MKSEIVKSKNENSIIYYSKYNAPWPASDRGFISEVTVKRAANEIVFLTKPSKQEYPIEKGVVRVTNYQNSWRVLKLENNMIKLELEGFYDPGGSLPAWIINMFIVDAPYESILLLKEKTEIID